MNFDFTQPQRQSPIGVFVLFVQVVQEYARNLWPFLLIMILRMDSDKMWQLCGGIGLFVLLVMITAFLRYRNFIFYIDKEQEEFLLSEGIFNKSKIVIPFHKIQQVNLEQNFIQKIVGVYGLAVDTAGTDMAEAKIKAISIGKAQALKQELMFLAKQSSQHIIENTEIGESDSTENTNKNSNATKSETVLKIGFNTLVKLGITSNYRRTLGLIVAFLAFFYENISRFESEYQEQYDSVGTYVEGKLSDSTVILILIIGILSILLLFNLVRVILKYFDLTIKLEQGNLLISYGLLNSKSTVLKPNRVQLLTLHQNYFQKKFDLKELYIKQAGNKDSLNDHQTIVIPGCSTSEADKIIDLIYKKPLKKGVTFTSNYRKLVFGIFLRIAVPLIPILIFLTPEYYQHFYIGFSIYTLLVVIVLFIGFKNYRMFIHDEFVMVKSGAWDVKYEVIEPHKIQSVRLSQLFWHKALNLGTITISTAGGFITFELGNYSELQHQINLWLYRLESENPKWM